jgi:hypothetical protein
VFDDIPSLTAIFSMLKGWTLHYHTTHSRSIFSALWLMLTLDGSRWLAPLLTQTLPLSSVYLVWDALFSCPMRERDTNAKLEHLLNICTSMLTRARAPLFRSVMSHYFVGP